MTECPPRARRVGRGLGAPGRRRGRCSCSGTPGSPDTSRWVIAERSSASISGEFDHTGAVLRAAMKTASARWTSHPFVGHDGHGSPAEKQAPAPARGRMARAAGQCDRRAWSWAQRRLGAPPRFSRGVGRRQPCRTDPPGTLDDPVASGPSQFWVVIALSVDSAAADFLEDLFGGCGPLERLWVVVVSGEVGLDRVDQSRGRSWKIPRRIALALSCPNQISTWLSHELSRSG